MLRACRNSSLTGSPIRNVEHYRRVVHYIESNPVRANLVRQPSEWLWSSARYRGCYGADELPRFPK